MRTITLADVVGRLSRNPPHDRAKSLMSREYRIRFVPPDRFQPMRSACLSLTVGSIDEAERIYGLLTDGGEIFMKMQETFLPLASQCSGLEQPARRRSRAPSAPWLRIARRPPSDSR